MDTVKIVCCCIVLGLCCIYLIWRMFTKKDNNNVAIKREVISSDDDPEMKQIAEFRQGLIENILSICAMVWKIESKDVSFTNDLTDWNHNLFQFFYKNHMLRVYVLWDKHIVCDYSYITDDFMYVKKKKIHITNGMIDLTQFTLWLKAREQYVFENIYQNAEERIVDCMTFAASSQNTITEEQAKQLLFEVCDEIDFSNKKQLRQDTNNLMKVFMYILKFHKEEFIDYLNKKQEENHE